MGRPHRSVHLPRVTLVAILGLAALAAPAAAHADLVEATPAPNSELDAAPPRILARFSEAVEDTYTDISVQDSDGVEYVERLDIDPDDRRRVEATLGPMPDGIYTVRWRTLSQADGHTRSGSYLMAVNDTFAANGGTSQPDGPGAPLTPAARGDVGAPEIAARGLGFIGASLAFGMPLAALLTAGIPGTGPLRRVAALSAAAGAALAALAGFALAGALAARIDADLATTFTTTNGAVLLQRIVWFALAAVALGVASLQRLGTRHAWSALGGLFAAAGLLATSMGGHAAAESTALAWNVTVDWLHQVAVAFWVSGVALLVMAAVKRLPEVDGAVLVTRFSPLAVAAVLLIIATGLMATMDRLPDRSAFLGSTFGLLILVKVLLVVPLIAFGAYHRYHVLPRLLEPGDEKLDVGDLRRSAGAELAIMVLVLLVAGALTSVGPPVPGAEAAVEQEDDGGRGTPYFETEGDGFDVEVFVEPMPPTVGFTDIYVWVLPHEGSDINLSAVDVFATFIPPSDPFGEASPIEGHVILLGQYHFGGAIFTEPGDWIMKVTVQGDVFFRVDVPIQVEQRE